MARAGRGGTATRNHDPYNRSMAVRGLQFLLPFLAPPLTFVALAGLRSSVSDNPMALVGYTVLLVVASAGLCIWVWVMSKTSDMAVAAPKRELLIRIAVLVSVAVGCAGALITLAVGWQWWWAQAYIITGEVIAAFWAIARIDSLRREPKTATEGSGDGKDLKEELGLAGARFSKAKVIRDEDGKVDRIETIVTHKPGGTAKPVQDAVPAFESLAADALGEEVPTGRSRAVPVSPNKTKIVIIARDKLKGTMPYPGPSDLGGCITGPLVLGMYEDQVPEKVCIAGGHPDAPNPTSSGRMGMTRSGKTAGAQTEMLEIGSRSNANILWFDTVKGAQSAEPLAELFALMLASDDVKVQRVAINRLTRLIRDRANLLGGVGSATWTSKLSYKLRLPFLHVQLEEADDLLKDPQIADDVVFIASKGLSVGVRIEVSLQRMDANSAPSGLRYNLGLNWVYGVGDDYSAGFLLTQPTIDAGAHPENWRQTRPGYHYCEGLSVPFDRAPVAAKSFFAENGWMRANVPQLAAQMMPLHPVDVAALNGDDNWFDTMRDAMLVQVAEWRKNIDVPDDAVVDGAVRGEEGPYVPRQTPSAAPVSPPVGYQGGGAPTSTDFDPDSPDEIRNEVDTVHMDRDFQSDGFNEMSPEAHKIDPSQPTPPAAESLSWGDTKPKAKTREEAMASLYTAFHELLDEQPEDVAGQDLAEDEVASREADGSVVIGPGAIYRKYRFRSRPWFSGLLQQLAAGEIPMPDGMEIIMLSPGVYRLSRAGVRAGQ